jgi:hypothetical protein
MTSHPSQCRLGQFSAHKAEFERLRSEYAGSPVRDVKAALQREWMRFESVDLPDHELLALAEVVSVGGPVLLA